MSYYLPTSGDVIAFQSGTWATAGYSFQVVGSGPWHFQRSDAVGTSNHVNGLYYENSPSISGHITTDYSFNSSDPVTLSSSATASSSAFMTGVQEGDWVYGHDSNNVLLFAFEMQAGGSSGSGGGGGFLGGGVSGASGSITQFGSSITWSIDLTSPSASASDNYYLKLNNIIYYNYGITHSNGQATTHTIPTQVGDWKLWHEDQNGGTLLAELTVSPNQVHIAGKSRCNFW